MNQGNEKFAASPPPPVPAEPEERGSAAGAWRSDDGRQLSLAEVRALYVGDKYHRFAEAFDSFDRAGKLQASFSWPAFFLGLVWFVYRKMYLEALVIFVAALLGQLLLSGLTQGSGLISLGAALLLGLLAKGLYWKAVDRRIFQAMNLYPQEPAEAIAWLARRGGVNLAGALILALFICALFFVSAAAVIATDPALINSLS